MKTTKQGVRDLGNSAPRKKTKCVPGEHRYNFLKRELSYEYSKCRRCGDIIRERLADDYDLPWYMRE
jgi:hypothetical protein